MGRRSEGDKLVLEKCRTDIGLSKVNAGVQVAEVAMDGLSKLLDSYANLKKTNTDTEIAKNESSANISNSKREQNRLDADMTSKVLTEEVGREIAVDEHQMKRDLHNNNVNLYRVKNSGEVLDTNQAVKVRTLENLAKMKQLEEELLAKGVTKEEIEIEIRKTEEVMLLSNENFIEGLKKREEVLRLELELERQRENNIRAFSEATQKVFMYNTIEGDILPSGNMEVIEVNDNRITLEFKQNKTLGIPYRKIDYELNLPEDSDSGFFKFKGDTIYNPLKICDIELDGKGFNLYEFGILKPENLNKSHPESIEITEQFIKATRRHLCEKRGRESLTVKEEEEFRFIIEDLRKKLFKFRNHPDISNRLKFEREEVARLNSDQTSSNTDNTDNNEGVIDMIVNPIVDTVKTAGNTIGDLGESITRGLFGGKK